MNPQHLILGLCLGAFFFPLLVGSVNDDWSFRTMALSVVMGAALGIAGAFGGTILRRYREDRQP